MFQKYIVIVKDVGILLLIIHMVLTQQKFELKSVTQRGTELRH